MSRLNELYTEMFRYGLHFYFAIGFVMLPSFTHGLPISSDTNMAGKRALFV